MASGSCGTALPNYWRALALYNVCAEYTAWFTKVRDGCLLRIFESVNLSMKPNVFDSAEIHLHVNDICVNDPFAVHTCSHNFHLLPLSSNLIPLQAQYNSHGEPEGPGWILGARSSDFDPLTEQERKAASTSVWVSRICMGILQTLGPGPDSQDANASSMMTSSIINSSPIYHPQDIIVWFFKSMNMNPPPGLRHHASPASGALARNRCFFLDG